MVWIVAAYGVLSLVAGVMAMLKAGVWAGAAIVAASFLSLAVVSGLKTAFFRLDSEHRLANLILSLVVIALIVWLSQQFRIALFGLNIVGRDWCLLGFGLSALYASIDRDDN